jgi:hypothetical protein
MNATWRILQGIEAKAAEDPVAFQDFLQYLFLGVATPDGVHNVVLYPQYFDEQIVPLITPTIIAQGVTDSSGKVELKEIPKGGYAIIAAAKGEKAFYFWAKQQQVQAKTAESVDLSTANASFSAVLK